MHFFLSELCSEGVYGNLSGQQVHSSVLEPAVKLHGDENMLSAIATFHAQLKTVGIDLSEVYSSFVFAYIVYYHYCSLG